MGTIAQYPPAALTFGAGTVSAKTANYTALASDGVLLADATSAAFTITLPGAVSGGMVRIKKTDGTANIVTVAAASGTIDGATTDTLTMQYQSRTYVSDGTNWFRV